MISPSCKPIYIKDLGMVLMPHKFQRNLLTDRGIREAETAGMLRLDPELEGKQRQPASIDLKFDRIMDDEPVYIANGKFNEHISDLDDVLKPKYESDVKTTNSIVLDDLLMPFVELRSSMRRLGCYNLIPWISATYASNAKNIGGYGMAIEIVNYSDMGIKLRKGDRIAQLMLFFDSPSREALDDPNIYLTPNASKEGYKRHLDIDHGYEVTSNSELRSLSSNGYFNVEPNLSIYKGLVAVHAGKRARVLKYSGFVDFSSKPKMSEFYEEVELPYRMKPGELIDVDTVESLHLSKHIGIVFHSEYLFKSFFANRRAIEMGKSDSLLALKWDGWIDPGYSGGFSRQPKTYYRDGKTIKPGDVLGYGSVFFFPEGVERPYGSDGLESHYQNGAPDSHI